MGAVKNRLVEIAYELIELEPALSFEDAFSRVSGISMSGMEDTITYHKWPDTKPIASGRYLVYCHEQVVPDHVDDEPYMVDARWIIGYYSTVYGWDANPKVIAWASLPKDPV